MKMLNISDMKIGARLALGFGLMLLCAIGLLALGLWRMSALQAGANLIVNEKVAGLSSAMDMREGGWSLALSLRKVATPTDATEAELESKKLTLILDKYAKSEAEVKKLATSTQTKATFDAVADKKQAVLPIIAKIKALVAGGNYFDSSLLLKSDFLPLHEKWIESLDALAEQQKEEMKETYEASKRDYENTQIGLFAVGMLTIALGVFISWFTRRSITGPLQDAARIADAIANGNLTAEIQAKTRDEAGMLLASLKKMQTNLVATINRIKQGTDSITLASREIATGNADLSSRTESQAGSLEETASSMEELTSTVKQNADNARQ
ncbi:MAG TPA: MCP four helix bundle domain-containing protein, partial [Burkholderiaceae bacterium]|nr:MCP four helix bundle domain-containing protein [Burkholderiaceae bacterium]